MRLSAPAAILRPVRTSAIVGALAFVLASELGLPASSYAEEAPPAGAEPAAEPATNPGAPQPAPPPPAAHDAPDAGATLPDDGGPDPLLEEYGASARPDPLERSNRTFFRANEFLYRTVFDPLADVYEFVFPDAVRRSFLRFFDNLGEPADFLNELLQLNPASAGRTGARFAVNTTVGVVGLFDPAVHIGLPARETDFGETLGAYGVGEGWYLVVPLLGPSTVRDLVGDVVDGFFHPEVYFLGYTTQALLATGSGFSRYEAERDRLEALRDSSLDFYSALRTAYLMQRAASVRETRADSPVLRRLDGDETTAAVGSTGRD